jgi:hypothetical protein
VSPEKLSAEQRTFVQGAVDASVALGRFAVEAVRTYVELQPEGSGFEDELRPAAGELLELTAVRWRRAEQAGATEVVVVEDLETAEVVRTLAAVQDSLVVALAGRPERMVSPDEVLERGMRMAAEPGPPLAPGSDRDDLTGRFDALERRVIDALGGASAFFPSLAPDGRRLSEPEREAARDRLLDLAEAGRDADAGRDLVDAFAERFDLRPSLLLLRSMVSGLVLRLSEDPARREQAIPLPELGARLVPVRDGWAGAG